MPHLVTRVLVTDHVSADLELELSVLEPLGVDIEVAGATDEATLVALAHHADALLVCYAPISRAVVESAASAGCRIIARTGIGVDNIDTQAASEHGILVTNVPDYCLDEVADHTILIMLAAERRLVDAARAVEAGNWAFPHDVHRLRGRKLALVGLGRIGLRVADRALAFGLEVVAFDPLVTDVSPAIVRVDTLAEALIDANFVSLHLPLTENTRHIINQESLGLAERHPILVNTSRGGLVDLAAVHTALDDGTLRGVALDVTELEPLPLAHPLRAHPRALVTPHMAFFSKHETAFWRLCPVPVLGSGLSRTGALVWENVVG
jgi:D-3-phosphoglycerate dehydrogenase